MKISRFSVRHPAVLTMILLALLLFGLLSISSTNVEFISNMDLPQIFVIAVYPGASAEDIESEVVDVLEDDFVTLPDFKSMDSQSMNSVGVVTITFRDGVDPNDQLEEVRNRISQLSSSLPDGLEGEPQAIVGGATMLPVTSFIIEGGDDIASLSSYVLDVIRPQLTRIPGVSTVEISGSLEPEIQVKLRMDDLNARSISPTTVYQILQFSNASMPLGTVESESRAVDMRFDGAYSDISEIENLPVGADGKGTIIRLSDVADIEFSYPEEDYYITRQGRSVIEVSVSKRADGNTLQITNAVKKILAEAEAETGGAIAYHMISDDSKIISASLSNVIESGVMGIVIAILVIFIFLSDVKATLAIGLSIPLSCFFTFIAMKAAGISVNLMSISGIVVALGSIVDASIVVLDQVYRFYQREENGKALYSARESIYRGTDVVDKSVIGSNLTTVVVFIPIAMISGLIGDILRDVSLTLMFAILSSLFVAIIFMPYILNKLLKDDGKRTPRDNFLMRGIDKLERGYRRALGSALDHTPFVLTLVALVAVVSVYSLSNLQLSFIPSTDNSDFYINVEFPYYYTLEDTRKSMEKVEDILIENVPELDTDVVYTGKSTEVFSFSSARNQGGIHAILVPVSERDRDIHEIIIEMQYLISSMVPDATVTVKNGGFDYLVGYISGGGGYGLTLVGNDNRKLYEAALQIEEFLSSDPEVLSVSISSSYDAETAIINASYEYLSSLGISDYEAAMTSAILFNGMDIGTYRDGSDRYDITLASDIADKAVGQGMLDSIRLYTQAGSAVTMDALSDLVEENSLSRIDHSDRSLTMTVSAQLTGESTSGVSERVDRFLRSNPLPDGVTTEAGGIGEMLSESLPPVFRAILVALFLVYMVIVLIYERFDQPLLIMLLTPFCIIGVVLSLAAFGSTLSMIAILGIVSLAGMLVNNGIIMVDYINQLEDASRKDYLDRHSIPYDEDTKLVGFMPYKEELKALKENVQAGTASRLRPILMSTLTTILGVLPMSVATGEGAEIYAPLGQVIMGGLTTSTFITLFLMPVFYFLLERHKLRKAFPDWRKEEGK